MPAADDDQSGRVRSGSRGVVEPLLGLLILTVIIAAMGYALWTWIAGRGQVPPPIRVTVAEQCVATANGDAQPMDLEQARNAGIIAAEGMRRGLPPRAVTIALATAMQESSMRNINYGDRDSVGLFQQRPSQGWGTVEQIMNPWYSAGQFYDHLVKVPGWQTADINDTAQKVQRSGYPDAYRKWEGLARAWASVLTGQSPAGLSCVRHDGLAPDFVELDEVLSKGQSGVKATRTATTITLTGSDPATIWSAIALSMTQSERMRIKTVTFASQQWSRDDYSVPLWQPFTPNPSASPIPSATVAVLTLG